MSLQTTNTHTVNQNLQNEAQAIFCELGLDLPTAMNIFYKQVITHRGFPFEIKLDEHIPNQETLEAFAEGERLLQDPNTKRFNSVEALFQELSN